MVFYTRDTMRKLIVFDLDGVLLDSCDIHYDALNQALQEVVGRTISKHEHETIFNGLSTRTKLSKLGVFGDDAERVYKRKQELTQLAFEGLEPSDRLQDMMRGLTESGIRVVCASNCIRKTVELVLKKLGIYDSMDAVFSNEDVTHPKPAPDMYLRAMDATGHSPFETLIFEDSYVGLQAAVASKAGVHYVRNPADLTLGYVLSAQPNLTKHVNIVIPMAGNGSRFANVGYKDPKPFIPVFGRPMISWVVDNLGVDASYTFIIRKEFEQSYGSREYLNKLSPGCNIVTVDALTEGAACTVLLAREHIDNGNPLIIINSDQYIEFTDCETAFKLVFDFLYNPAQHSVSGTISTFDGKRHPKWSYAKIDDAGLVTEVREKDPFSDHATTGLYMWRHGSDFVKYSKQMIVKNIRVNNEFYVVPVFNEAIADGCTFNIVGCDRMWGIGVPEDLELFLRDFRNDHLRI
jgi:HAD superfamily hydrolase (TIGR01509 family)